MDKLNLKDKIVEFIASRGQTRVDDLWRNFGVSRVLIHRHLKQLLRDGKLVRVGRPPLVFYSYLNGDLENYREKIEIPPKIKGVIEDMYLYVSALGEMVYGMDGFLRWVDDIKETEKTADLAIEYVKVRSEADSFMNRFGYVNATKRIETVFSKINVDRLYYLDFYSLPKFGKTKLGQLVLYAKQSQKISLIDEVMPQLKRVVSSLIQRYKIDAIGFIPPTIPRKRQFQKEIEKKIGSKLPIVTLVKAYSGDIPVAQKSLSRLDERVANARGSIFIKDESKSYNNVLLIDDAVGSGSTINETALKLKQTKVAKRVIGLALVGSYKGFEVIREI